MRSFQTHLTVAVLSATFTAGFAIESSAAMDFLWAPTNPEIGEQVTFTLSGVTGSVARATWNFGEDGCDGKSATQVCTPGLFNDCKAMTFAFASGDAKTVSVAVELEGGGTTNVGPKTVTVQNIGNCNDGTQPYFTWLPTSPSVGENVLFTINGVPVDIDKATWNMGGTGSDGEGAIQVCTPTLYGDCKTQAFKYASGGSKVVQLSVEIDGITYTDDRPASDRTVTVAPLEPFFTWLPTSPAIGDNVVFTIEGTSSVNIDEAHWNFGGAGCDGINAVQICTGNVLTSCKTVSFEYATGGPKIVTLSIVIDGDTYTDERPAEDRTVTVSNSGGCTICSNKLLEPGFEGGSGSAWSESSSNGYFLVTMNRPHSGDYSAWLGGADNEQSSVWQTPTIDPMATSAKLTYWYDIDGGDDPDINYGYCGAKVNGVFARGHEYDLSGDYTTHGYVESEFVDLLPYAGTSPEIRFEAFTASQLGSFYVDDVMLEVCVFTSPNDQVFSDGFESGDTTAWSASVP